MKLFWPNWGFGEMDLVKFKDLAKCILAKLMYLVKLFWPNGWIWRNDFGEIEEFGEMIW